MRSLRVRDAAIGSGNGYLVELFGLPAAGKSRLLRELRRPADDGRPVDLPRDRIGPEVMTALRLCRKLGLVGVETWRRPNATATIARAVVATQRVRGIDGIARVIQWTVTQGLMASAGDRPGIHAFDEGVLQALWSIGLRGNIAPVLRVLERHIGDWARPDLVLVVHCPIEEIASRLADRGSRNSRIQRIADPHARMRELERGQELLFRLLGWWAEIGGGRVIELKNDPDRALGEIAEPLIVTIASEAARTSRSAS